MNITTADLDWTFHSNLQALFWITKAAIPHMPPGASIINGVDHRLAAIAVAARLFRHEGDDFEFHLMSRQTARREGDSRQNRAPRPVWTSRQPSGGQTRERLTQFGADAPLGRIGQPTEIAPL